MGDIGKLRLVGAAAGVFFTAAFILSLDYHAFPWFDELATADTAANCALHTEWRSQVWQYSYCPLHLILLTWWLSFFGVSHLSVCSFDVLLAGVGFFVLLDLLCSRRVLKTIASVLLFTLLYWCGWRFSEVVVLGRVDMLVLVCTVMLCRAFIYDGKDHGFLNWSVFLWAFLTMLSGIYSIPPLVVAWGAVVMLDRQNRKRHLIRAGAAMAGFVAAFAVASLYYFHHRLMIQFVYSFFMSSTTLSGAKKDWLILLKDAYSCDIMALVLTGCVAVAAILKKNRRLLLSALLVGSIPLVMVAAGRYCFYYSWLFYLPVVVLVMMCIVRVWVKVGIVAMIAVFSVKMAVEADNMSSRRDIVKKAQMFINTNEKEFAPGCDVVMVEPMVVDEKINVKALYYPLVRLGVRLWNVEIPFDPQRTFEEHVRSGVSRLLGAGRRAEAVADVILKLDKPYEKWPDEGFLICRGDGLYEQVIPIFNRNGQRLKLIDRKGELVLAKFTR